MTPPRQRNRLRWEILPPDAPLGEAVPIYCATCQDTGTIPSDPIFVNTDHSYGVEYRSEEPCPDCETKP